MEKHMENQGISVTENRRALFITHGYARCSTNESKQDIDRQVRELRSAGADRIWLEYEHGDSSIKSQQSFMLMEAQSGDTILVSEVSRLARSVKQLCTLIDQIRDRHLRLVIIGSITMDCRTGKPDPMTEAFLQIAGVFSQLELSMIRQRLVWIMPEQRVSKLGDRLFGRRISRTVSFATICCIGNTKSI